MNKTVLPFLVGLLCLYIHAFAADNGYIVKFNEDYSIPASLELVEINKSQNLFAVENVESLSGLEDCIEYIEPNASISLIEDVPLVSLRSVPSDSLYAEQWQLQMVNPDSAWELETYGNNVNVAIIDSGCNKHIDVNENIVGRHNYFNNSEDVSDNIGHGTHVSGIIGAGANGFGITGVAPKANLYILKCFEDGSDTTLGMLASAIYDAVNLYKCRIINMSFGTEKDYETLHDAISYAAQHGVIMTAAVGNNGTEVINYPAGYSEVIGVGSVGMYKAKSTFSQMNNSVFVVAPGEYLKSLGSNDGYVYMRGTSQSTPIVSGAAALLLSADPNLTSAEFSRLLSECSEDLGVSGYDTSFGYGLINVSKMLDTLLSDTAYYVSPFNGNEVLIFNNSSNILNAVGMRFIYSGGQYKGLETRSFILLPGKKVKQSFGESEKQSTFVIWKSLKSMQPLSVARIKEEVLCD